MGRLEKVIMSVMIWDVGAVKRGISFLGSRARCSLCWLSGGTVGTCRGMSWTSFPLTPVLSLRLNLAKVTLS